MLCFATLLDKMKRKCSKMMLLRRKSALIRLKNAENNEKNLSLYEILRKNTMKVDDFDVKNGFFTFLEKLEHYSCVIMWT